MKKSTAEHPPLSIEYPDIDALREQSLDELVRFGAQLLLQAALDEEVTAFLERRPYERVGEKSTGYRNGSRPRNLKTGAGDIDLRKPKVTGCSSPFRSQLLPAWRRTTEAVLETVANLYVEGLSTRDFSRALSPLMEPAGLSRTSISRANQATLEAFEAVSSTT